MAFYRAINERRAQIEKLKKREETILLYEAPHRLKETLRALSEQVKRGTREIVLARQLTKRFEEFLRGTLEEAVNWVESNNIRGEFCIVLEGNDGSDLEEPEATWWDKGLSVLEHVSELIERKGIR